MTDAQQLMRRLGKLSPKDREGVLAAVRTETAKALNADWPSWAHVGQSAPDGDWRVWVLLAGRGFGKTRAGAEWVSAFAREHPGAAIALVGATVAEARSVLVEGRSGLLAVARPAERRAMLWQPTRRRLVFASGAEAFLHSGASPESLRGPEHHLAWCDELAKWRHAEATWRNLRLGLRLGELPRVLVTTTPKRVEGLRRLLAAPGTALTRGGTRDNPHLPPAAIEDFEREYGGTHFGRQELDGELLDDVEGALWPRELIARCRVKGDSYFPQDSGRVSPAAGESNCPLSTATGESNCPFRRVVIGVDPPAAVDGACGIVVCGLGEDGLGYVLADHSAAGLTPEGWAAKAAAAAQLHGAHRVVAEANNGGRMVEAVLRAAGVSVPVKLVHAAEGKAARAAPVAALFESGRAKFAGRFAALEDELAGLSWDGRYQGPGRSPDRADAMVWAMTELMLGRRRAEPRIWVL